jgi:hypothetical protein
MNEHAAGLAFTIDPAHAAEVRAYLGTATSSLPRTRDRVHGSSAILFVFLTTSPPSPRARAVPDYREKVQ